MGWRKDGEVPKKQRVTIIVNAETNPALAKMIYAIPYGGINRTLIDLLEKALGGGGTPPPKVKASRDSEKKAEKEGGLSGREQSAPLTERQGYPEQTSEEAQEPPEGSPLSIMDSDTARLVLEMSH